MIYQFLTTLSILVINTFTVFSNVLDTCHITIQAPSLVNKSIKLGYYYGSKTFLKDTLFFTKNEILNYEKPLHSGIYLLVFPDSSLFEFMIDDGKKYYINVTFLNQSYTCLIKGNPVTEAFNQYQHEYRILITKNDSLYTCEKNTNTDSAITLYKKHISELDEKILILRKKYCRLFPGSLLSNYLKSFIPIDIKEIETKENKAIGDTGKLISKLKLYQKHYLDNIDINDDRLLFTTVFDEKINFYLDKIISQKPDIIASEIERIFNLTDNSDVKKFMIENQINKYRSDKFKPVPEYIYASLIENVYLKGKAPWASNEQLFKLKKELDRIKPTLLFNTSPEIKVQNITNDSISLYSINAKYTLLLFWDMNCPYCSRIIKGLNKTISKYSYLSIKVFTVSLDANKEQWIQFVSKNMPVTWINTIEPDKILISETYNIEHTPMMYFLDKDKKIINKNFTIPELETYLLNLATGLHH